MLKQDSPNRKQLDAALKTLAEYHRSGEQLRQTVKDLQALVGREELRGYLGTYWRNANGSAYYLITKVEGQTLYAQSVTRYVIQDQQTISFSSKECLWELPDEVDSDLVLSSQREFVAALREAAEQLIKYAVDATEGQIR